MRILLVGTGYMAKEYAKVLKELAVDFDVVGRGEKNCKIFSEMYGGIDVTQGGLERFIFRNSYSHAIIASNVECLLSNTRVVAEAGIKYILLEKPGGKNVNEISELAELESRKGLTILLAYNRRFYSSVLAAKKLIEEDGGVASFNFEFTEWPHTITGLPINDKVKEYWVLANSSHVIDTAFHLGGRPVEICCFTSGGLEWHPAASVFAGAGISDKNAVFSYSANWEAPGRWVVEILTRKRRYIFKPMEKLQVQELASVTVNLVEVDDELDKRFKPGLYLQTKAFINSDISSFCTAAQQKHMTDTVYKRMSNYQ